MLHDKDFVLRTDRGVTSDLLDVQSKHGTIGENCESSPKMGKTRIWALESVHLIASRCLGLKPFTICDTK